MTLRPQVYEPSKSLRKRLARRLAPYQSRRMARFKLDRPIVSFTFDDCPKSVIQSGTRKLEAQGWKSTIYIATGLLGQTNHHGLQMDAQDVMAAHDAGHEIGEHSHAHIDISELSFDKAMADISTNRQVLADMGLPPCRTFAYPFGQTTRLYKKRLAADYMGLRGITSGPMIDKVDLNQIHSTPLFQGKRFDSALRQIKELKGRNSWLTLFTHDIVDTPTKWGCTPAQMDAVIAAVKASGAEVLTVENAIKRIHERAA